MQLILPSDSILSESGLRFVRIVLSRSKERVRAVTDEKTGSCIYHKLGKCANRDDAVCFGENCFNRHRSETTETNF